MMAASAEPHPRRGHFSAPVEDHLVLWGGEKGELAHTFNQFSESWSSKQCQGPSPPDGLYNGASAYAGHHLYLYGGHDGSRYHNSLHQLDTRSWTWSHLSSAGPMCKVGCGMVTYGEKLLCFGGYGIPSDTTQPADFVKNSNLEDGTGWTNELYAYDLCKGTWSSPPFTGTKPPPCAFFSFTKIDEEHAVLFGGEGPGFQGQGCAMTNDVYMIEFKKMHWSKLHISGPCPMERSSHAAVCLGYGGDNIYPHLLVSGGSARDGGDDKLKVLGDVWILHIESREWREVTTEPSLQSRCQHSATALSLSCHQGLIEVTLFGGTSDVTCTPIANTTVLRFEYQQMLSHDGPHTSQWVLTGSADSTQLGTPMRVQDKAILRPTTAIGGGEAEEEPQWVVERGEIQLTGPELGRGRRATVSVATFRGDQVAAKLIHTDKIVSQNNIRLFKREMNMASGISNLNLLQFIGATLEGEMVILTELMPTSLRKELKKQAMLPEHVNMISLDVARGLKYLHLMRPYPLIHRDISSANVLLEPLPNSRWRAKVSDYGTVNLFQQLEIICPGNTSYAAPEASDPNQQSTKMDIFSFGILLLEMLAGEFPDINERGRLLDKIRHQPLLSLVQRCLKVRKEDRPNASDIISELN